MFQQTSVSLEKGLNQIATSQENATNPTMEAMQRHLVKMAEAMAALQTEVTELRAAVANRANVPAASAPKPKGVREEISSLCSANRFEEAFTKAVSASDGTVVLFTCKSCDILAQSSLPAACRLANPFSFACCSNWAQFS